MLNPGHPLTLRNFPTSSIQLDLPSHPSMQGFNFVRAFAVKNLVSLMPENKNKWEVVGPYDAGGSLGRTEGCQVLLNLMGNLPAQERQEV
jgi:hypothetical protein